MKKLLSIFLFLILFGTGCAGHYNTALHELGNAQYMIREARHAGANKHSQASYQEALRLVKTAWDAHKKHNLDKARDLAGQAYTLAKQARDDALATTGKRF